jgi:uncharacterized protein YcaQ
VPANGRPHVKRTTSSTITLKRTLDKLGFVQADPIRAPPRAQDLMRHRVKDYRAKLGYYALPMLWRNRVIGWGNVSVKAGRLKAGFGYVEARRPRERAFKRELEAEVDRLRFFLSLDASVKTARMSARATRTRRVTQ